MVWLILIVATALSWALDQSEALGNFSYAGVAILVISILKVRFVISEFMEVRTAPLALKLAADGWCVLICILLIVLFLRVS